MGIIGNLAPPKLGFSESRMHPPVQENRMLLEDSIPARWNVLFFRHLLKAWNVNDSGDRLINRPSAILFQDKVEKAGITFQISISQ